MSGWSGWDAITPREWQRVRRYAVPGWMIAECTEARERGDWRAACAAAAVDVTFASPGPAAEMLAGFAPDLLRWHLPRALGGTTMLDPDRAFVLAPDGPVHADTVVLVVRTPPSAEHAQRLTLDAVRAGDVEGDVVFPLPPHLWDARRAGELREVARAVRLPPSADWTEAWATSEWRFGVRSPGDFHLLRRVDPTFAGREVRRVAAQFGRTSWALWSDAYRRSDVRLEVDGDGVRVVELSLGRLQPNPFRAVPCLHLGLLCAPIDLNLLHLGLISPEGLHPLVREALTPDDPGGPVSSPVTAGFDEEDLVRVRCGGVWHWVGVRAARLELHEHSREERQRELSLRALGGAVTGCFAVAEHWRHGGSLPKRLRAHRRDLWLRLRHGGTRVLLALLDAGLDPHVRDGAGRTLLHELGRFDVSVLPRLLAEGLLVNARDRDGNTPLFLAVSRRWPTPMVTALVDAGASPHIVNRNRMSVLDQCGVMESRDDLAPEWAAAIAYVREKA
ncbi:hypothetical protein QLQ12_39570 [Actinoplanes sp. NEAU-A12]|uniref:Ankyrin repeat domain-containing protein n=1 Tax=Actinoplanes sandaracinus TaxID=3045177 RepID=A0ABT6WY84_9ACTN|nr:hypothetical protein [Actinoplanes sandaracinus]MDI6104708.1 hypothetical protein [Actinoplanes sandaracinus]